MLKLRRPNAKTKRRNLPRKPTNAYQLVMCILLTLIAPVFLLSGTTGDIRVPFLLSCFVIAYAGFKISTLSFDNEFSFLQLTHWIFVYCWMGLAAAAQIKAEAYPWWNTRQTDTNIMASCLVVIAGMFAYEVGANARDKHKRQSGNAKSVLRNPSLLRYSAITAMCIGLSIWGLEAQGGLESAFMTRYEVNNRATDLVKSDALIASTLQHTAPMIALLVTIFLLNSPNNPVHRWVLRLSATLLIIFNLIANYPPSLPRVTLGSDVLSITLLLLYRREKFKPALSICVLAGLVILFPYLDFFRYADGYSRQDISGPSEQLINKPDYDAFQMTSNAVAAVSDHGLDFGRNLLGSVLFFVPRAIWSNKPYGTGQRIAEDLEYINTNVSCPLWAEFYYSGGVVGVIIGFWFYGRLSRLIEEHAQNSGGLPSFLILSYAAGFQIFLLRGDLMNGIAYSIPSYMLLGAFFLFGRRTSHSAATPIAQSPQYVLASNNP